MTDEFEPQEGPADATGSEVQLISDGDGLAVIGAPAAVGNPALESARMTTGRLAGGLANRLQRTDEADVPDTPTADEAGDTQ